MLREIFPVCMDWLSWASNWRKGAASGDRYDPMDERPKSTRCHQVTLTSSRRLKKLGNVQSRERPFWIIVSIVVREIRCDLIRRPRPERCHVIRIHLLNTNRRQSTLINPKGRCTQHVGFDVGNDTHQRAGARWVDFRIDLTAGSVACDW